MKKILVTGGGGRFSKILKSIKTKHQFIYTDKKKLNITKINSIKKNINKFKPNYILHLAGLSRPMSLHNKEINNSIDLNIIGTCNLVNECVKKNIKLIYFSTSYVYPGNKGFYKETSPVLPWNNYAWSKLGGECAVQMYKNSLILRVCMTEKPFVHKSAYANVKMNFIYHKDLAKILIKLIHKKGIYNLGGKSQSVYNFVKKDNKNVKKKYSKGEYPLNQTMNINKLNKALKK
tara:strand:+ start:86 stop:784 length:699 start_codon:yes stop_codon:yes gene_type:complete